MEKRKSTRELDQVLGQMNPEKIEEYLKEYEKELFDGNRAFADYMREMFREKYFSQQEVFLRADMPERYGYKIVSMEKHTVQRDVILRLCIASRFDLTQTNRALKLYGVSELYSKIARDALIITAINAGRSIDQINELLKQNGFEQLYSFSIS